MTNIYFLREKIGDAVWLWTLVHRFMKVGAEEQWFICLEGKGVSDMEIGTALFCASETVIAWRERLESLGLIRSKLLPEKDAQGRELRTFEVKNLSFSGGSRIEISDQQSITESIQ
jgi:hypothetical protein